MRNATRCSNCERGTLLELEMTAKNGQVLALASCTRCETRTWTADGHPVSKDDVLKISAGDPDFRVIPSPTKSRRSKAQR